MITTGVLHDKHEQGFSPLQVNQVATTLEQTSNTIQTAVSNTIENVRNTVTDVASTLEQTANNIGTAVDNAIDNVKTAVGDAAKSVGDFFGGLFGG
jgi:phage-related protein